MELIPQVVGRLPHDRTAFTQGLVVDRASIIESTGSYGASSIRRLSRTNGRVLRLRRLPERYFGEGIALVGTVLWQLTWRERVALRWDAGSFQPLGQVRYRRDGWGACFDGRSVYTSDGSAEIVPHDPRTLRPYRGFTVKRDGAPVSSLNALGCSTAGRWRGLIWANLFGLDDIVGFDARSGKVLARVDASALWPAALRPSSDVLNGIAPIPRSDEFYLTGKNWPWIFQVRFVPKAPRPSGSRRFL